MKNNVYGRKGLSLYAYFEFNALLKYRHLARELTFRDIKTRYKRSILGVAWTMINPLITTLILYIIFSQIFETNIPNFAIYLLSGLLLWNFFAQSSVAAMRDLVWNSSLLQRVSIPKSVFALAAVGTGLVNLLLAFIPLFLVLAFSGAKFTYSMFFVPVSLLIASLFTLGIGLGLSALAVFFTDIVDMYNILLLAWMYLTPIFYPIEILAPKFHWLIYSNPMYYILETFRMPIYLGVLPPWHILGKAMLSAVLSLLVGGWFFAKKSDEFAYYI